MKLFHRSFFYILVLFTSSVAVSAQEPQIARNLSETKNAEQKDKKDKPPEPSFASVSTARIGVESAQPIPLSLNDAIKRALEQNNGIEISRDTVRLQEQTLRSLLGVYDPVFSATPTYTKNHTTGETNTSGTRDFSVNSNLTGFLNKGGGNYRVIFNNTRTENAFTQAQVSSGNVTDSGNSALYQSTLGVTFTQPLFRNLATDTRRHNIKIARKQLQQSDADFRRTTIETISQVQQAYWDFVFALRDQQNQQANVDLAKENLRQIEARIAAGASAPLERAEVATELATRQSSLLSSTQQVSIVENTLKQLIIKDATSAEWLQTYVPTDQPVVGQNIVDLDAAMKDAMANRYELQRLKFAKEINDLDLKYYKNQTKPQVDLNTSFSVNGLAQGGNFATTTQFVPLISRNPLAIQTSASSFLLNAIDPNGLLTVPTIAVAPTPAYQLGGFNQSLANMFRRDAPNYTIGVTFSFPIGNRTAKANYASAKIQQEQIDAQVRSQEETVVLQVRNAVQALETARQTVIAARTARENAEIQLDGERKLYESGKSTTFLLFQRENALTNARNLEIRSETDYNKALATLQSVTATTFQVNNIEVVSPSDQH